MAINSIGKAFIFHDNRLSLFKKYGTIYKCFAACNNRNRDVN